MTYEATLDYLFSQLPIYQRVGKAAYKADLSNTIALCEILKNPERGLKVVHVAGTNGKGSVSHIVASVLQEAGFKTGLYTSPHLKDFRERIRINGEMIPKDYVVDFVARYRTQFEPINASFFEMTVGLAFRYFADEEVDIAVIEVGLGGRLDSTNVVSPEVSVITNIGLDHTQLLGDTLALIATEKAGIIKEGIPVVIGESLPATKPVFEKIAAENHTSIHWAENAPPFPFPTDLTGNYQQINLRTASATFDELRLKGWPISDEHMRGGVLQVVHSTGLTGRWQKISSDPLTICDVGHNQDGLILVLDQIAATPHEKLHFVIGMVNDKNISEVLSMLPKDAEYYFTEAKIPRALPVAELHAQASQLGLNGLVIKEVKHAIETAQSRATAKDLVFVGGSVFVVAEALS